MNALNVTIWATCKICQGEAACPPYCLSCALTSGRSGPHARALPSRPVRQVPQYAKAS